MVRFTDGCTMAPDFNFVQCCVAHDYNYADQMDRKEADLRFLSCIISKGHPVLAYIYYFAVRLFGWYFYNKLKKAMG